MSNIYIKIIIHVLHVHYCNGLVLKKLESLKWGSFLVVHYKDKYLKNEGCFYHRIKPLSKCLRHNTKLKCNNIKTLYNRLVDLLVACAKIESIINTSTILSNQRRINRIATSHSKMGILHVHMYLSQWRLLCHRIKLLSLCSKLNNKLTCKEIYSRIIFLFISWWLLQHLKYHWHNYYFVHSKMGILLDSMKVALSSNEAVTYILVFEA